MLGQAPILKIKIFWTTKAVIIATGTNDNNLINARGRAKFLTSTKGITRDNQVTRPQPRIVSNAYVLIPIFPPPFHLNNQ